MGKGEIARYEQFLLFPQCFQKACFPGASKGVVVWKWVKKKSIETTVGKGEKHGNQHYLLFLQYFLSYQRQKPTSELRVQLHYWVRAILL